MPRRFLPRMRMPQVHRQTHANGLGLGVPWRRSCRAHGTMTCRNAVPRSRQATTERIAWRARGRSPGKVNRASTAARRHAAQHAPARHGAEIAPHREHRAKQARHQKSTASGRRRERFWMGLAVVLGQDDTHLTGPVRHRAPADITPHDGQVSHGYGETISSRVLHRLPLCQARTPDPYARRANLALVLASAAVPPFEPPPRVSNGAAECPGHRADVVLVII